MEIDNIKNSNHGSSSDSESVDLIKVRAKITCPNGDYKKTFRNQFKRHQIEEIMVAIRIFDWMTCSCGELLDLNLEFVV